jgi:hypothetical protein
VEINELEKAAATLQSLVGKLEKCAPKLKAGSAQVSLVNNRLAALNVALGLMQCYADLLLEQETALATLEKLKTEGKEKTVTYRELFGKKLLNKTMLERLARYTP